MLLIRWSLPVLLCSCAAPPDRSPEPVPAPKTWTVAEMNALPPGSWGSRRMDLSPARWIWFPSRRTLPNTFVLFRRDLTLPQAPVRARGWITADSRYRLTVNGTPVQWGPAPSDPRWPDVDPVDLSALLKPGANVIGVEVLYYGLGEGTWAGSKPGLLFHLELDSGERILSDDRWLAFLDRAHAPGRPKRWYLRALQEEFDARLHPYGWDAPGFTPDARWLPAMPLEGRADRSSLAARYPDYLEDRSADAVETALRSREIPPLRTVEVPAARLAQSAKVTWVRDPADWFEFRTPGSFRIVREPAAGETGPGAWEIRPGPDAAIATFEFKEQIVGWPRFTIDAAEGTIVELMTQEAHDPSKTEWLDTHFFSWSRFICREGINRFQTFDFESLRWLQLHVRNARRPVVVREVGMSRRLYPWPNEPRIAVSDPALQRVVDAGFNTLYNSAQETCVDGMGRERQQYSGDGSHQLIAARGALGDTALARRFLRTFSEGITQEGYFLDTWPGLDRLIRMPQRQIGTTKWGPLLDFSIAFSFDCWNHYLETGDLDALREPWPRLLRAAEYLERLRGEDGLLPVENLGIPAVFMDHDAYRKPSHKQCAFNLYAAAGFRHAWAPLARAFGDSARAERFERVGEEILAATVRGFWCRERKLFVANRPWLEAEREVRLCDRSLAASLLFDQCPGGETAAALAALVECPPSLGLSFPANATWRYWALARWGRADVVLEDFRKRWAPMKSVVQNNAIQEVWEVQPDSRSQWSHCALVPVYFMLMDVAGIRPAAPGYARAVVRPQLTGIGTLDVTLHTVRGPFRMKAEPSAGGHRVRLEVPADCRAELQLPSGRTPLRSGGTNEFSWRP